MSSHRPERFLAAVGAALLLTGMAQLPVRSTAAYLSDATTTGLSVTTADEFPDAASERRAATAEAPRGPTTRSARSSSDATAPASIAEPGPARPEPDVPSPPKAGGAEDRPVGPSSETVGDDRPARAGGSVAPSTGTGVGASAPASPADGDLPADEVGHVDEGTGTVNDAGAASVEP